jgi:hypothetical protein
MLLLCSLFQVPPVYMAWQVCEAEAQEQDWSHTHIPLQKLEPGNSLVPGFTVGVASLGMGGQWLKHSLRLEAKVKAPGSFWRD